MVDTAGPWTRTELIGAGYTDRRLAAAVGEGRLRRLRGGVYCGPALQSDVQRAAQAGGRLTCISELDRRGVWVLRDGRLHVHFQSQTTRAGSKAAARHWQPLLQEPALAWVSVFDAVVHAVHCQPRLSALAALDSARNLGMVSTEEVERLARLSQRARLIANGSDARAESGLETAVREILRAIGVSCELQVTFEGIGRVDVVVAGAVVVEADGDRHHTDLAQRRRDRRRDALLTAINRPVLRFGYDQILGQPGVVAASIIGAVESHRDVKNARALAAAARLRAAQRGWA